MWRQTLVLILGLVFAAPALASGGGNHGASADPGGPVDPEAGLDPSERTLVRMPYLLVPVAMNGELDHYIFITYQLKMAKPGQGERVVRVMRYLEDAFLRASHEAPIQLPDHEAPYEIGALKQRVIAAGNAILKDVEIADLVIENIERPQDPNAPPPLAPPPSSKPKPKTDSHGKPAKKADKKSGGH